MVMQKAILKRICGAPSLYKFASVVSAGAPVVMKYSLFSRVLLLNMQGTPGTDGSDSAHRVHVSVATRERDFQFDWLPACDQKILTTVEAFIVRLNEAICFQ